MCVCACMYAVPSYIIPEINSYSIRRARMGMDLHDSFEGLSAVARACSDSLQVVATIVCVSVVHTQVKDGQLGLLSRYMLYRCAA